MAYIDRLLLENVRVDKVWDASLVKCWTDDGDPVFRNVTCGLPREQWVVHTQEPFVCKSI